MAARTLFRVIAGLMFSVSLYGQIGGGGGTGTAIRIPGAAGVPSGGCTTAGNVGKVYVNLTVAGATTPLYICSKTGASSFGWVSSGTSSGGSGTVLDVAGSGPSWLTWSIATPTTHPTITLTPTTAQTSHQVIGTCNAATTFAPCTLVAGDIPTLNQSTSGNAATATALATNGTNCSGGTPLAAGVDASGNAEGCTGLAPTATAFAANGTNCSAGNAPLGVDASGNSESCTKIVQQFFGTAAPGSVSGNLPGDRYSDTTNHNDYWCNATSGTAAPACTSVSTGGWTLANSAGGGGSVFTGSTGSTISTSATPAFSLADVSVKSPTIFNISPVVNVTGPTITNKSAGAKFYIRVTTDGTHSWSWNSIVSDGICPIYTASAQTTIAEFTIDPDGSTVHGTGCISGIAGLAAFGATVSAPTDTVAAGNILCLLTAYGFDCLDPSAVHHVTVQPDTGAANNYVSAVSAAGVITKSQPACTNLSDFSIGCSATFVTNAQTSTYQVLAADFTNLKTIFVSSGTFTITLVASGTQPANGKWIKVINYGSGVITVARSGQNINGGTASYVMESGSATNPSEAMVTSNGTDYQIGGGFTNPMTTAGDVIISGTTGLPTRTPCATANTLFKGGAPPGCAVLVAGDIPANIVSSAKMSVVNTYGYCDVAVGDTSGSVITDAQLGPQKHFCKIPMAATVIEIDVDSDAGSPSVIVGRGRCTTFTTGTCSAETIVNLMSSALAVSSGFEKCSNTGGTTGLDGGTTCSSTLQNTGINAGDWIQLVSGTAGGTAKFMTIHIVYTIS